MGVPAFTVIPAFTAFIGHFIDYSQLPDGPKGVMSQLNSYPDFIEHKSLRPARRALTGNTCEGGLRYGQEVQGRVVAW